jgi:carbamoyltransferase
MLNCVANGKLRERFPHLNFFAAPACGDDGLAVGSALYAHSQWKKDKFGAMFSEASIKQAHTNSEIFTGGRLYSNAEILASLEQARQTLEKQNILVSDFDKDDTPKYVADLIADGKIVAWFEGGSECGPRALGHRSILADARDAGMKDKLNARVKHREPFRPFCPVVLKEHASEWFKDGTESPFMLFSTVCLQPEKVPSAAHVDNTSRIQTIDEENNGFYYKVVKAFYEKTGIPLMINTSFNIQGEPIVETPLDALNCFANTEIDCLVLQDVILIKQNCIL